jgi:hypothetical protein
MKREITIKILQDRHDYHKYMLAKCKQEIKDFYDEVLEV